MEEHGIFGNDSRKRIRKVSGNTSSLSKLKESRGDGIGSENKKRLDCFLIDPISLLNT